MGKVKDKAINKQPDDQHKLTDEEYQYVKALSDSRTRIYEEQGRTISAFLYYIAGNRLGYDAKQDLQFELDFDDPERVLKITKLESSSSS